MATETTEQRAALARELAALTWYHTIDLGGGLVTPGEYDTRAAVAQIPFPASLAGRRCLDVGTHDGSRALLDDAVDERQIVPVRRHARDGGCRPGRWAPGRGF